MSEFIGWEKQLNDILKHQGGQGRKFVTEQLKLWCSREKNIFRKINNYTIIDFKKIYRKDAKIEQEYLVVRNCYKVFKSFKKSYDAINYCLDKINTESEQNTLEL